MNSPVPEILQYKRWTRWGWVRWGDEVAPLTSVAAATGGNPDELSDWLKHHCPAEGGRLRGRKIRWARQDEIDAAAREDSPWLRPVPMGDSVTWHRPDGSVETVPISRVVPIVRAGDRPITISQFKKHLEEAITGLSIDGHRFEAATKKPRRKPRMSHSPDTIAAARKAAIHPDDVERMENQGDVINLKSEPGPETNPDNVTNPETPLPGGKKRGGGRAPKPVSVDGVVYGSIGAAAVALGIPTPTLNHRLARRPSFTLPDGRVVSVVSGEAEQTNQVADRHLKPETTEVRVTGDGKNLVHSVHQILPTALSGENLTLGKCDVPDGENLLINNPQILSPAVLSDENPAHNVCDIPDGENLSPVGLQVLSPTVLSAVADIAARKAVHPDDVVLAGLPTSPPLQAVLDAVESDILATLTDSDFRQLMAIARMAA